MLAHNAEVYAENTDAEKTCICYEPIIMVKELAQAYVPIQFMCELYNGETSLIKGTIFPELYKHYDKRFSSRCTTYVTEQI